MHILKKMPVFVQDERLSGCYDTMGAEQFYFLEGAFDVDLIVHTVVVVVGLFVVCETLNEEDVVREMSAPFLFVSQTELLGVGAG
jgi:hypothetical protein